MKDKVQRLYFIDNLRWIFDRYWCLFPYSRSLYQSLYLVVVCYSAITRNQSSEHIKSLYRFSTHISHVALFVIGAFFSQISYNHKGPRRFLIDRFKRLGIPLLITIVLLSPALTYLGNLAYQHSDTPFSKSYLSQWGAGVMWFIEPLLLFTVLMALFSYFFGTQQQHSESPP
ncbi:acyltransferase family protein, partial [Piscirickettsia litoralis]|uniref:acyltransferase family protein n=1 Tax=Piscirickettsia litoralis TaxID=1891921 RepID=UPI001F3B0661